MFRARPARSARPAWARVLRSSGSSWLAADLRGVPRHDQVVDEAILGAAHLEVVFGAPAIFEAFQRSDAPARAVPVGAARVHHVERVEVRVAGDVDRAGGGVGEEQRALEFLVGVRAVGMVRVW